MQHDHSPKNQSTPAVGPQHIADHISDDNTTASNNGNTEPVDQPAAEVTAHHADSTPIFADQKEFLDHVVSKMAIWRGFLYNEFPSLHCQLDDFVEDVICKTLKRCTNTANASYYSNFDPDRASFNTWFCWKLKGVALDIWKKHYKRKCTWEARHDTNISIRDDATSQAQDKDEPKISVATKEKVPSVTYTSEWDNRLDLQQGFDALALHLTPAEREVFQVMLTGVLEYKDIARVTGKTEVNVGVIIYRIRKKVSELVSADSMLTSILDALNNDTSVVIKNGSLPYNYNKGADQESLLNKNASKAVPLTISKSWICNTYVVDIPGFLERWNCYSDDERQDVFYDFNPDKHRPHKGRPHWKAGTPDLAADSISSAVGPMVQFPYAKLFPRGTGTTP